jgi:hypothetical protein
MPPLQPFRPITTAPTDRPVEVLHGRPQSVAAAQWNARLNLWVRVGDPEGRGLRRVIGWREKG